MSLRVLIGVTHLLGVGHLTRAAALARAFARAGHNTTLVSGGLPAPLVRSDGVRFVQLPPIRTVGTDFRTLLDESGQPVAPSRLEARREMLKTLVEDRPPDVILTELFPFGRRALAGEFMALIEHAKAACPETLILASVRDILVAPGKPERVARTHEILREFYDAVVVHGDPDLVPIEDSWPVDGSVQNLVRYTGYVDDGAAVESPPPNDGTEIVVSGGGSAASLPLYRAAISAAEIVFDHPWRILVGAGVAEPEFAELCDAAPTHVTLERARSDFRSLLVGAAVSISQAGYNTVVDVLRTGVRAVFVPFEQGNETEQRLRAERLATRGVAEVVPEADLSPAILAGAVRRTLRRPPAKVSVALDGARQSVAIAEELATKRFGPAGPPQMRNSESAWRVLDDALRRAAEQGAAIPFWWRDDDAVAHTPQLDRLLALARRSDLPLAIAAIPAHVEPSLCARLEREPLIRVLVHGLAHENHAPSGAKKAEFGDYRPLAQLAEDAAKGLRLARSHFADLVVPVFVPPWNRIAPRLVEQLPGLGFRGLSAFGERPACEPTRGLVQVNAHIDPIAWHEGGRLRDINGLLNALAGMVARRADSDQNGPEPIGLLSHHLLHDEAVWHFCETLLARLVGHPGVRFIDPVAMFVGAQTAAI